MSNLYTYIKQVFEAFRKGFKVCMPARIETYDYKLQKASVKVDTKVMTVNGIELDNPVVSDLPVVFMCSGGASITMPVNEGDSCYLLVPDIDMTNWLLGGADLVPDTNRNHDISDAIVIMGLKPFNTPSKAENNTDLLITYSNSSVRLKPNGVIDIESAKKVNVKSDAIDIIVEGDANIKCYTATTNCNNANIYAADKILATCDKAEFVAVNTIDVMCKDTTVTATGDITTTCKTITANCEDATVNARSNITTTCKTITANCEDANVTATGDINTTATKLKHKGDMEITGELTTNGVNNTGTINSTGTIKSNSDVVGGVLQISLTRHYHPTAPTGIVSSPVGNLANL